MKIKSLRTREILDSRGIPTLKVYLKTDDGFFIASVPSGVSEGEYEALEIRDGGDRFFGKGVLKAIKNISEIIAPELEGKEVTHQEEIDRLMIELDGTENKSRLGANTLLGVSRVLARAGAEANKVPLYRYINQLTKNSHQLSLPTPCFNIINGGIHAGNDLQIQEFMIAPFLNSFSDNLRAASEIYHSLKEILKSRFGKIATNIGDEGGFAPLLGSTRRSLEIILEAVEKADYKNLIDIIIDAAASEFYSKGKYIIDKNKWGKKELTNFYLELLDKYPIIALEDPFAQDDWEGWQMLNSKFQIPNSKLIIFGDDLLATNVKRIKEAEYKKACNGLVLKMDQIGTITEALEAAKLAKSFGWKILVSHRSGETNDDFISDFAVGIGAEFIKSGAPVRGERVAKYNRLLEIEEELRSGT